MSEQNMKIGDKIKNLRIKKGASIADIAKNSAIAEAVLAGIEDHSISPPLGNLVSLANVFQVTLGSLLGDSADSPYCIVRRDERKTVSRFNSSDGKSAGYSYESLGHQKQYRKMEPFMVTLTPTGDKPVKPNQHSGEEILFVVEGQVEVTLADHTDILNPGDSIYYDSNLPHIVACHGDKPASIFAVIYAEKEMLIF
jgi:mannose-6-phosphate isomerase-like protein (cupin superfamily)